MLQYDNESQLLILFRMAGSVLPSSCAVGLLTFVLGTVLAILRDRGQLVEVFQDENYLLTDDFFRILCTVVGFLLVMRTNQALSRWMHAVTQVEVMLSKWSDAYNALNSFFSGKDGTPDVLERILLFRIRVAHWFSLMSCLAFATLTNGSVSNLAEISIRPKYPETLDSIGQPMLKTSFSGQLGVIEEGRKSKGKPSITFEVLHAPTEPEVTVLEGCADKVNIISLWIIQGIMREVRDKTLDAPPPIVTRVFQEISKGMLGFAQAHKVAMVPFPFPFAQMVTTLLTLLYIAFPFFIDCFTQHVIITPIISFIIPVCYESLNRLAIDLEVPFGTSQNCIDIEVFNQAFLDLLEDTLMQPQVPPQSEYARLEREIIHGIEFSKPREDPVPNEGAALVPAPSFARTPDPMASAAVMPVASMNMPRSTEPAKMGADRSSAYEVSGPRAAARYHAQRRTSNPPVISPRTEPEARLSTKIDSAPAQRTSARPEAPEARLPFKVETRVQNADVLATRPPATEADAQTSDRTSEMPQAPEAVAQSSGRTSEVSKGPDPEAAVAQAGVDTSGRTARSPAVVAAAAATRISSTSASAEAVAPATQTTSTSASAEVVAPATQTTSTSASAEVVAPATQTTSTSASAEVVAPATQTTSTSASAEVVAPATQTTSTSAEVEAAAAGPRPSSTSASAEATASVKSTFLVEKPSKQSNKRASFGEVHAEVLTFDLAAEEKKRKEAEERERLEKNNKQAELRALKQKEEAEARERDKSQSAAAQAALAEAQRKLGEKARRGSISSDISDMDRPIGRSRRR